MRACSLLEAGGGSPRAAVPGLITAASPAELRLLSTASAAGVHGLSCITACRISSDQGYNSSPPLAGGFFTTEPPGKPLMLEFLKLIFIAKNIFMVKEN